MASAVRGKVQGGGVAIDAADQSGTVKAARGVAAPAVGCADQAQGAGTARHWRSRPGAASSAAGRSAGRLQAASNRRATKAAVQSHRAGRLGSLAPSLAGLAPGCRLTARPPGWSSRGDCPGLSCARRAAGRAPPPPRRRRGRWLGAWALAPFADAVDGSQGARWRRQVVRTGWRGSKPGMVMVSSSVLSSLGMPCSCSSSSRLTSDRREASGAVAASATDAVDVVLRHWAGRS